MQRLDLNEDVVILDTETTGLQVDSAEICEIAIIDYNGKILLNSLVKPTKPIPEQATAIHGITNDMVASAPSFADLHDRIIDVLKDKTVVIYNKFYDCKILAYNAKRAGLDDTFYDDILHNSSICAMQWYSNIRKQPDKLGNDYKWHKLTEACKHERVDISNIKAHRAYADCMMTLYLIDAVNTKILTSWVPDDLFVAEVPVNNNSEDKKMPNQTLTPTDGLVTIIPIEEKLSYTPTVISFDDEYYSSWATNLTAKYQGLVITEAMLPEIKKELANLNKFKGEINDSRIKIVKEIKLPIDQFEAKVKSVIAIIDKASTNLKAQADTFEEKRRNDARTVIAKLIANMLSNSGLNVKYHSQVALKDSYLNKTATIPKITTDVQATIDLLLQQQTNEQQALELQKQQLANRELKLQNLNAKFSLEVKLSDVHNLADDKLEAYFVTEDSKRIARELEAGKQPLAPVEPEPVVAKSKPSPAPTITPKPTTNTMLYKNVRIGGANMGVIIKAIAQLRNNGFEVNFVD